MTLAGDVYRRWVDRYEGDPELTPAWLADELRRWDDDVEGWRDDALEFLFGDDADRLCAERNLMLDGSTRRSLLREVAQAVRCAAEKLIRNIAGDYSPDPAARRFPEYEGPVHRQRS